MSVQRRALKDRAIVRKDDEGLYDDVLAGMTDKDIDRLFKFAIVRNPYARVVSAWEYLISQHRIRSRDFSTFVCNTDLPKFDIHFHRQVDHLFYLGKPVVDFIGKLENIENDWHTIAMQIGAPLSLPRANKTDHPHWETYYTPAAKEAVAAEYRADFALLGYET
jgi:chondroitin 4-sulfotransferase 11